MNSTTTLRHGQSGAASRSRLVRASLSVAGVLTACATTPAFAQACGAPSGGQVNCPSGGNPYPDGIAYDTPNDLEVSLDSDVSVDRATGTAVDLRGRGDASLGLNAAPGSSIASTAANADGVRLETDAGDISITTDRVDVTSTNAVKQSTAGITALSQSGDIDITTTGMTSVTGSSRGGITAVTNGAVRIEAAGITTGGPIGTGANGITVQAQSADIVANGPISVSGGRVVPDYGAFGIFSLTLGDSNVVANGPITVASEFSAGILAESRQGSVSVVNNGKITTSGNAVQGIFAAGYQNVTVISTGAIETNGPGGGAGLTAIAARGDAYVEATSVVTRGLAGHGVDVNGSYGQTTVRLGSVETHGDYADGVAVDGFSNVDVEVGTITTTGNQATGLVVRSLFNRENSSPANLTVKVDRVMISGDSTAVLLASTSQEGLMSITAGELIGTGDDNYGAIAYAYLGDIAIDIGRIELTGKQIGSAERNGLFAHAVSGDVAVRVGEVTTHATRSDGLNLLAEQGRIDFAAGSVVTHGADADAIDASAAGDIVAAVGHVQANGANADGMRLSSGAGITAVVVEGGHVGGGIDAVDLTSASGAALANGGTIVAGSGVAIRATGGAATILNAGTIRGRIALSDAGDRFVNGGVWETSGESSFGGGEDLFENAGIIRLGERVAPATLRLTGLERLANRGVIDLTGGGTGDVFTIDGGYVGSGDARLVLDVAAGAAPSADRLRVGNASGTTGIDLVFADGVPTLLAGVTLVEAGTASDPAAFKVSAASAERGLVRYDVTYDPASFAYRLVGTPSSTAYRMLALVEGAEQSWLRSADVVTEHRLAIRRAGPQPGMSSWVAALGEVRGRDERRNVAAPAEVDLGYRQDHFGSQGGYDLVRGEGDSQLVLGITGGYQSTTLRPRGGAFLVDADVGNLGVSAMYRTGAFFIGGLAKADRFRGELTGAAFGETRNVSGWVYGAEIEAGAIGKAGTIEFEPMVGLAFVRTDLGRLPADFATITFDQRDGLRGRAGMTLRHNVEVGGGNRLAIEASGEALHDFGSRARAELTDAGGNAAFHGTRAGTWGRGTLRMAVSSRSGLNGFIEAHGESGSAFSGVGGRAGIGISF